VSQSYPTPFDPCQIIQLVETIWNVVLDCEVRSISTPANFGSSTKIMTGMIELNGAWEGVVAIECPTELVGQAAALMFETDLGLVTQDQLEDCLRELTNIVAGNLKALLPPPTYLGLPTVSTSSAGTRSLQDANSLAQIAFETSGFAFVVTVLSSATPADRSPRLQSAGSGS
jgi:chemotaxis protein CheX